MRNDPLQMKEQELKTVTVTWGKFVDGGLHERDAVIRIFFDTCGRLEQFVIDFKGDEWGWKFVEILLERGGYGVNVEVWVRYVVVVGAFKAFLDLLDLCVAAGFAVNTFNVHTWERNC